MAISACSEQKSAQTYITEAESLLVKEQNTEAAIALKNALKIESKNTQARFLLGSLYLEAGDAERAIKELELANRFKYDTNQVLPLLARSYMLVEDDEQLLSLAAQEKSLSSVNTQYLAYKTLAALRTNQSELAQETVNAALAFSKTDGFSMLANAYLEFSKQNVAQAGALVKRTLMATPDNVDALMLQGQIATVEKNYELAVDSFKRYLALQPNSGKVRLFIADGLVKNGQYSEAEEFADSILAKVPTQPFMQYIKAMARFSDNDYQAANSFASQSLSSGFKSFSLKLVAGASAFYLKNYEQSNLHLTDIIAYLPPEHAARRMLAVSQLQLGLIDDVGETLKNYDSKNQENAQFLSTLSYELLELGAYEKAQEMADYVSQANDLTPEQTARAGVLKLMMNDPTGIENLELALKQNPEMVSAELALAFASIKAGDLTRATEIAEKWLQQYPDKAGGHNLQATILFKKDQLSQGKAALERSLELEPNNVYALTQMVKLAHHQKDTSQAMLWAEQALKAHPENLDVLRLYFEFHKNEEGLKVITKAQKDHADNVSYGILLAEALMHLEQFKQASTLLNSYQVNVKTPKRYWQLVLGANGKLPESKDVYLILNKWNKTNPYHIEPVFLLVNYWTNKKSPERALSILKEALNKSPNNLVLHLIKMQVLLDFRRNDDAKHLLESLAKFDIDNSVLAGIEGRIFLLDRKFAEAIPKLQLQYQAKPTTINATYLALALEGNGQQTQAIKLLEQVAEAESKDNAFDANVSLTLANMYLADDKNKAVTEYERLIKVKPNNIVALNNLSWLYMKEGKLAKSLEFAKLAYEQQPKIPNVVDTYGQALLKSGQKIKALAKAKEAYELSEGKNVDIALNYAEILLVNKRVAQGKALLSNINAKTALQKEKKQQLLK